MGITIRHSPTGKSAPQNLLPAEHNYVATQARLLREALTSDQFEGLDRHLSGDRNQFSFFRRPMPTALLDASDGTSLPQDMTVIELADATWDLAQAVRRFYPTHMPEERLDGIACALARQRMRHTEDDYLHPFLWTNWGISHGDLIDEGVTIAGATVHLQLEDDGASAVVPRGVYEQFLANGRGPFHFAPQFWDTASGTAQDGATEYTWHTYESPVPAVEMTSTAPALETLRAFYRRPKDTPPDPMLAAIARERAQAWLGGVLVHLHYASTADLTALYQREVARREERYRYYPRDPRWYDDMSRWLPLEAGFLETGWKVPLRRWYGINLALGDMLELKVTRRAHLLGTREETFSVPGIDLGQFPTAQMESWAPSWDTDAPPDVIRRRLKRLPRVLGLFDRPSSTPSDPVHP